MDKGKAKNCNDHRDPDWPTGLYIRNTSYRWRRKVKGKAVRIAFGPVSLAIAIGKAEELNNKILAGVDLAKVIVQKNLAVKEYVQYYLDRRRPDWRASTSSGIALPTSTSSPSSPDATAQSFSPR